MSASVRIAASALFLVVLALAASIANAGPTPKPNLNDVPSDARTSAARAVVYEWALVPPPEEWDVLAYGGQFREIEATSDGAIWMGSGRRGVVRHSAGEFEVMDLETNTRTIHSLSMIAPDDGWASSRHGFAIHFDGVSWKDFPTQLSTNDRASFQGISMVSANDGWMCTDGSRLDPPAPSRLLRFDGTTWDFYDFPEGRDCRYIEMVSATDGWITGGPGELNHFDGHNWTPVSSPTTKGITDFDMISATDGWAVAGDTFLHYDGVAWQEAPNETGEGVLAIDFVSPTEGWAVGRAMLHYVNGEWSKVDVPVDFAYSQHWFNDIKMISPTEGWAVGTHGLILHYRASSESGPGSSSVRTRLSLPLLGMWER